MLWYKICGYVKQAVNYTKAYTIFSLLIWAIMGRNFLILLLLCGNSSIINKLILMQLKQYKILLVTKYVFFLQKGIHKIGDFINRRSSNGFMVFILCKILLSKYCNLSDDLKFKIICIGTMHHDRLMPQHLLQLTTFCFIFPPRPYSN